jgi:hypothetical protein
MDSFKEATGSSRQVLESDQPLHPILKSRYATFTILGFALLAYHACRAPFTFSGVAIAHFLLILFASGIVGVGLLALLAKLRHKKLHAGMEDRRHRRRELRSMLDAGPKADLCEIMGDDFNAPAGDTIYKLLNGYGDSHRVAGRGWGKTALNTIPAFRPDQIWLKRLSAVSSHGVRTVHSDHRMVVTDVLLESNK